MGLKPRASIIWVALVSIEQSPYDVGAAECVRLLKAAGIRAKTGHSPYVGHHTVLVPSGTRRKAARVLGKTIAWVRDLYRYGGFTEEGA